MSGDPYYMTNTYVVVILLLVLLFMSGSMIAAHSAIVSCSKNEMKEINDEGDKRAKIVIEMYSNQYRLLSATYALLIFFTLLVGEVVALKFGNKLGMYFAMKQVPFASYIAVIIITMILVTVVLVFSFFYPRQIGRKHSKEVALVLAGFANNTAKVLYPLLSIMRGLTTLLLAITRQGVRILDEEFSEEDVIEMIEAGTESGALKEEGKKMINSIFAFDDILAYEIMTPRTDVFSIDIQDDTSEYIDELMELKYSRIPVYDDDSDNIIGILNIKDFFIVARENGFDNVEIKDILREPFLVPETKNIDSLFYELQKTKQHIAILIDEYGGFSGIATLEDIIEEVMGDIDDEYDEEEHKIEKIEENLYMIDGFMDLDDINEELGINLESENNETVGGLIVEILGEIPNDTDKDFVVNYENCELKVESVKDRRIHRVTLKINEIKDENKDLDEKQEKNNKEFMNSKDIRKKKMEREK